jgi:glycosyltransferase involved in cell wall biosynthesis
VRILFAHQNFPGQYKNILNVLAREPGHELVFLTQRQNQPIANVKQIICRPARRPVAATHPYVRGLEGAVLNGQATWRAATKLKNEEGFRPDIMIGHNGWGETLFLKDVYPDVPLLSYFEFFYSPAGSDIDFDPEFPSTPDTRLRSHVLNAGNLIGLQRADWGQVPTTWQRDQYPRQYHDMLSVVHEGIDTDLVKPDPQAWVALKSKGVTLRHGDEIITYVARNLEPYRGFHIFMRTLPEILKRRPKAHVLIVGGDEISYGAQLPPGQTYRKKFLAEVGKGIDLGRVHFLGRIPYPVFLKVLQVSAAHVYLTYPFVLSWSMLEAMAAECVVIASSTPPVLEVIRDRQNGLLVDFFSTQQIADTIDTVLDHPDRMEHMRKRARKTIVERYDFNAVCLPQQRALVDTLAAGRRPIAEPAPQREPIEALAGQRPVAEPAPQRARPSKEKSKARRKRSR